MTSISFALLREEMIKASKTDVPGEFKGKERQER